LTPSRNPPPAVFPLFLLGREHCHLREMALQVFGSGLTVVFLSSLVPFARATSRHFPALFSDKLQQSPLFCWFFWSKQAASGNSKNSDILHFSHNSSDITVLYGWTVVVPKSIYRAPFFAKGLFFFQLLPCVTRNEGHLARAMLLFRL